MQHPNQHAPGGGPSFPPPPQLPPGWEQAMDPSSGLPYYANRQTGETSWTPPPYFPPPPPPPVVMQPPQQPVYAPPPNQHFQHSHLPPQPQMMLGNTQPTVISQPMAPLTGNNLSVGNNVPVSSSYPQQYLPQQPQMMEIQQPSINVQQTLQPNPLIPTPQEEQYDQEEEEVQPTLSHSKTLAYSGLGPSTVTTPGLLVPSVRAMIDTEYTHNTKKGTILPKLELEGLSAGAIADLCNVSRELKSRNMDGGDFAEGSAEKTDGNNITKQGDNDEEVVDQYYLPLQPFALPVSSLAPHIEPGRVDIRLHALHTKLGKI